MENFPKTSLLVLVKCKVWNVGILFAASGMPNASQQCCWLFEGVEDFLNCWQSWLNNIRLLPTWWNAKSIIFGISQTIMIFGVFSKDMMQEDLWRALDLCNKEVLQFLKSQVSLFIDWMPHFYSYKTSLFLLRRVSKTISSFLNTWVCIWIALLSYIMFC